MKLESFKGVQNQRNPEHSMKAPMGVCYVLAVRKK